MSAHWGVCLSEVSAGGGVSAGVASAQGVSAWWVSAQGVSIPVYTGIQPPWTERQTGVKRLPCHNYVVDGNEPKTKHAAKRGMISEGHSC